MILNRKTSVWLLVMLLFVSGKTLAQGTDIDVKIKNFSAPEIYLGYYFGDKEYVRDTAKLLSDQNGAGHYHFKSEEELNPGIYFVVKPGSKLYFQFVPDEKPFSLTTDTLDIMGNLKVTGSPKNALFLGYQQFITEQNGVAQAIQQEMAAVPKEQTEVMEELRSKLQEMDKKVKAKQFEVLQQHPNSMAAKVIKSTKRPEIPASITDRFGKLLYYRTHFWDNFDLSDPALLRTQFYNNKVEEYMEKLTYPHPDSLYQSASRLIELAKGNEETFRYMVVSQTNFFEKGTRLGSENVFVKLAKKYYLSGQATWTDEETISKVKERVEQLEPNLLYKKAAPIELRDPEGNELSLDEHNAPYTVLFFYDPDCGHCKKETPIALDAFHELRDQGIEFWGITTVTDTEKWHQFIEERGLDWINGEDPYVQSNFRYDYDIRTTPMIYVLDKDKKIIAKKIAAENIVKFIQMYQKNNP
ncbi:DUF5106 domain-containing protein [Persicobacter psychrovividus]|uniref:Thioredoxin domain-containing protein n=1 Tax=Persicobacter psychrovividus TaxID=387638 RepID=A0ABM7VDZ3_9BACT|nr:hypothetical protein PEPS_13250 [Persicobacter psychrovividus]